MIQQTPTPAKIDNYNQWDAGIADSPRNVPNDGIAFGRSIDVRSDQRQITLLSKTTKESGTVVTDLIKDGDEVDGELFMYGNTGNIYKRTSAGSISLARSVSDSSGNGMKFYGEDGYLYYTTDKYIGRYGQLMSSEIPGVESSWTDNFLAAEGGVPLNTHSLNLEASSSMYADRADTASLSITGDLAIECWINMESLPTVGNSMVLVSKWNVNGNARSYKFEIYAVSGYFGSGTDGALTISSNTTEAPIDSACTGTSGAISLSATNASFAAGQIILIHQSRGTGAGTYQRNKIISYTAGTITLESELNATYTSGAQVRVLPQYTNVTINSGITYSAKAWNGTVGGILAFISNGTVTVSSTGSISASGTGYRGGAAGANGINSSPQGHQGEGTTGFGTDSYGSANYSANGNGGGGGSNGSSPQNAGAGGGGGNGTAGTDGTSIAGSTRGVGGSTAGTADLTTANFGGGGGGGQGNNNSGGAGGAGGGLIFISGITLTISGSIVSNGANGAGTEGGGGGGAGGSILLKAQTAALGTTIATSGGAGGATRGGAGGVGRIHLDYLTSYTGTTTPTLDYAQDNSLVTTTTYQLRLGLSNDGTAEEFLARNATITTDSWIHVGVSWDASDHEAEFFQDGASLGSSVGAFTAINNNASRFAVGADFNNTPRNFFDGLIDEPRVFNTERTQAQISANKAVYISATTTGLVFWSKFNNNYDDVTGTNTLAGVNSPTFSTNVPFSAATTRLDLDQSLNTSGNTYTAPAAIDESATHRQTFVPAKDPQKSVEINFGTKGAGDVTVTVHDSLNRIVHQKTVDNSNLPASGDYEFLFDTVWTPIRGATYHFHITSTTADATVVTTTASDLETADFHTYYQFLTSSDNGSDYHPIEQMLNFLVIGNGRYVAKYDAAAGYDPHKLVFPAGWRVRCISFWRGFVVFGCWKGDTVTGADQGRIFLWDGYSTTYNDSYPVPEGSVNAMTNYKGTLVIWAGYHGEMCFYNGGDSLDETMKKRVPKITDTKYIETLPKAVGVWDSLLRWGVGGDSDSSDVERGVYTYGRKLATSPVGLTYDYPISTGSRATTNVKIGFIYPIARKLIIGWQDNVSYGVDVVDNTGNVFATGTVEQGIRDYGKLYKEKQGLQVGAEFEPLIEGQSITVKYKLDDGEWVLGEPVVTVGATQARLLIEKGNARRLQVGVDLATTVASSPVLLEDGMRFDPKATEGKY